MISLEIRLLDANRPEVWEGPEVGIGLLHDHPGESFESARQKVFDRLARWVVAHLESSGSSSAIIV